jgi:hypothetical protein
LISASALAATLVAMAQIELIPQYRPDGTVVLRAVVVGSGARLRRFLRRLRRRS